MSWQLYHKSLNGSANFPQNRKEIVGWMSHARMSRNASTTRALLRSKSRLPSDLLTTQIPLSASYSGLSSPLQSQSPLTTTITNVNSSKNNASSCYRRLSSIVRRLSSRPASLSSSLRLRCCWEGLGCHLSGQRTYSFSVPALPLYTLRFYPLGSSPPPPLPHPR